MTKTAIRGRRNNEYQHICHEVVDMGDTILVDGVRCIVITRQRTCCHVLDLPVTRVHVVAPDGAQYAVLLHPTAKQIHGNLVMLGPALDPHGHPVVSPLAVQSTGYYCDIYLDGIPSGMPAHEAERRAAVLSAALDPASIAAWTQKLSARVANNSDGRILDRLDKSLTD